MQGANHLRESDAAPLEVCPVDLHKLIHITKCDPQARCA